MTQYRPYISKDYVIEGNSMCLTSVESAWKDIDGRMRTEIRKAEKSGAKIRTAKTDSNDINAFRAFCLNPEDMPTTFTPRHHFYLAELQQEIVAGILLVSIGKKLFMLCHASKPIAKHHGIPSLLIWHTVKEFAGREWTHIDIGASYRPSLQKYFSGWKTEQYPMIMKSPELHPNIHITPFDTESFGHVATSLDQTKVTALLQKKFSRPYTFFPRATYGIYSLVRWLQIKGKLTQNDNIWVTTTTDSPYVSSCVSSAIEQTCAMSRSLNERTRAIFVIHEFGFPHPKLSVLRSIANERGIPLIEDCAYAWESEGTGTTGDYIIYSLTKKFPVQFGGYVVGLALTHAELWKDFGCSDVGKQEYAESKLLTWLEEGNNRQKRQENYHQYEQYFGAHRTIFSLTPEVDPGAFVLRMENEEWMQMVSGFVRRFGTECGNFWKNSAIILPVHQRMTPEHVKYVAGSVLAMEREGCGVPEYPVNNEQ